MKPNCSSGLLSCWAKAGAADEAAKHEPELDLPPEIKRREDWLKAISDAKTWLEQHQREAGRGPRAQ